MYVVSLLTTAESPPPIDDIWAVMPVWRITGKIIRTALCCIVYYSFAQWCADTWAVSTVDWFLDPQWYICNG